MQSIEVRSFKNELKNYRFYQTRVKKLGELIEYCYTLLPGNIHGKDLTKPIIHSPPDKEREYRIREEIEHHEQNKRRTQAKITEIDLVLAKIETSVREALIDVYADGKPMRAVASKMYISHGALQKRINKAVQQALSYR